MAMDWRGQVHCTWRASEEAEAKLYLVAVTKYLFYFWP